VQWIASDDELTRVCARLRNEEAVALDVETTLYSRTLCLVQLGTREHIYVVDALEIVDFAPLARLLGDGDIVKIIHNASFEKQILSRHGITIANIADTLALSRARHGMDAEGGHKLATVCQRELGIDLDKSEQTSDWARRPLTRRQLAYAALDVEVLFGLWDRLQPQTRLF
jgi:ribonuclease D